jgi:PAS domain S-box-containing protein
MHVRGVSRTRHRDVSVVAVCLAWVLLVSAADVLLGERVVLLGLLLVASFIAAAYASPGATSLVAALTLAAALALGGVNDISGTVDHAVRSTAVGLSGVLAVWLAAGRRRRERELAARERDVAASRVAAEMGQRLHVALDAGRMGTWAWRSDSGEVVWDGRMESLFGLAPGTFDGTFDAWVALLHPDDRDEVLATVAHAVAAGKAYRAEHRVVWPDGTVRWLEGRGEVVRGPGGEVTGTTGVTVDITERKRAEEEAVAAHALTTEVLGLRAMFEDYRRPPDVARVACAAARRLFGCDAASFWTLDGESMRLVWRNPPAAGMPPGSVQLLTNLPALRRDLTTLRPSWLGPNGRRELVDSERRLLDRLHVAAGLRVPLTTGGEPSALLTLLWTSPVDPPSPQRLTVIERFATQTALAMEQAQRRAMQAEAAELTGRLQAGLLPAAPPRGGRFAVTTFYRPGEGRLLLGGDFFDVLAREDDSLAFVIGDVSGHGPEAAALGATIRAAWSGLALAEAEPETCLRVLDQLVANRRHDDETFATVAAGHLARDATAVSYTLAGHPAPILLGLDVHQAEGVAGPPLGVAGGDAGWALHRLPLTDPWGLLLFTDGLIEGRAHPQSAERYGVDQLLIRLGAEARPWTLDERRLAAVVREGAVVGSFHVADDVAAVLLGPARAPVPLEPFPAGAG